MAKIQVNRLVNMNVYLNGANMLGRANEVALPEIKQVMQDHKGLGMFATAEVPAGLDKLEMKITWNSFYADATRHIVDPRTAIILQVRGNLETHNAGGLASEVPIIVEVVGRVKGRALGTAKQQESVEPDTTIAVHYYKLIIDGEEMEEVDVLENIWKVNGIDMLTTYRRNLGA